MNIITSISFTCFCLILIADGQNADDSMLISLDDEHEKEHSKGEKLESLHGKQDSSAASAASAAASGKDSSASAAAASSASNSGSDGNEDSSAASAAASSGSDGKGESSAASASSASGKKSGSYHKDDESAAISSAAAISGSLPSDLSLDKVHLPLILTDEHTKHEKDHAHLKDKKDHGHLKDKKGIIEKLPLSDASDILKLKGTEKLHKLLKVKKDVSLDHLGDGTGLVKDSVTSLAVKDGIIPSLLSGVHSTLGKGCGCHPFKDKLFGHEYKSFLLPKLNDGTKDFLSHCNAEKLCCALNGYYKEIHCFFSCKIKFHVLMKGFKADGQSCMFVQNQPGVCKFGVCIPRLDAIKENIKDKLKQKIIKEIVSLLT